MIWGGAPLTPPKERAQLLNYCNRCFTGCMCRIRGSHAVFSDGSFLLDARRGNLPLLVFGESLQRQQQDDKVLHVIMG